MPNPTTAAEWAEVCRVHRAVPTTGPAVSLCLNCADAFARQQVEAFREKIRWLDEFVVEPEWFPNEGDRQYWRERRAAIRALP